MREKSLNKDGASPMVESGKKQDYEEIKDFPISTQDKTEGKPPISNQPTHYENSQTLSNETTAYMSLQMTQSYYEL